METKKAPAPGSLHQGTGSRIKHHKSSTGFPICKLYKCAIVDCFPRGCPFAAADRAKALLEMKNRGWANLHPEAPAHPDGLDQLSRYDLCWACFGENLRHPAVRRLRRAVQTPAETVTADTGRARNGKQQRRPARRPVYV